MMHCTRNRSKWITATFGSIISVWTYHIHLDQSYPFGPITFVWSYYIRLGLSYTFGPIIPVWTNHTRLDLSYPFGPVISIWTYHSFIKKIHIVPLLFRSAPNPCMAKENSFEARVECVRVNSGEQSLRERKFIPHGRANH